MTKDNAHVGKAAFLKTVFVSKTDNVMHQFLRYIWVGATTTLIDLAIMNIMFLGFGVGEVVAASYGYMIGVVANYFLCIAWIFQSDKSRRAYEFIGSMVIGAIGLGLNDLIIWAGTKWPPNWVFYQDVLDLFSIPHNEVVYLNIAKFASIIIVLAWNFLARKYIIFRKPATAGGDKISPGINGKD